MSTPGLAKPRLRWLARIARAALLVSLSVAVSGDLLLANDLFVRSSDRISDEVVLQLFCAEGRLFDRGVTNSVFAGPTDGWIAILVGSDPTFARALGITEAQQTKAKQPVDHTADPELIRSAIGALTQVDKTFLADSRSDPQRLKNLLTPEQLKQLPSIYLALEGMMALRRNEFESLVGMSEKQQAEIVAAVDKCMDEKASPLHRAIFTLQSDSIQESADLNLLLRAASAELDKSILQMLNAEQRAKLAPIVRRAYELQKVVPGPGCR